MHSQTLPSGISGLAVWLKSDSGVVLSGSNVSSWNDISGNNYVFNAIGSSNKPSFVTATNFINGKPTLSFDGVDDGMISNKKIVLGNSGVSIFLIAKVNSSTPYGMLLCYGINSIGTWNFRLRPTEPKITFIDGLTNSGAGLSNGNSNDLTSSNYEILSGSFDSGSSEWKIGENSFAKDSIIQPFTQADSNLITIGFRNDLVAYLSLDISEILIFNRSLSKAEDSSIVYYLRNRYTPPVELGSVIKPVCDTSILLNVGNNYAATAWSNGSTSNSILISNPDTITVTTTDIFGFSSFDSIILTTFQNRFQFTTFKDTLLCENSIIWDTNLSGAYYDFNWSTGDSDSLITIASSDIYFVTITDTSGCIEVDTANIIFDNFPTTVSLGPDTSLCSGNSITLTNGNQSGITYLWNDSSTNSSLVINISGEYYLTATNSNNCVAKDTINVTIVGQAPFAGFQSTFTCENTSINFTDTSFAIGGGTITNWFWNFGDDSATNDTAIVAQPNYIFSNTGSYTINLTVTTNAGCKQNLTKNIYIYPKPIVDFINVIACQNDTAFFNEAINPLGYPITNYQWNFGDGATATSSDTFHIFLQNTNYQVQLIATNTQGCVDTAIKTITVRDEVSANFNYSSACINVPISFTDNSIAPAPNASNTRSWAFFPGTATGLSATKTFTNAGFYPVRLTVTGFNNCISSITKQIQVSLPPDADFNSSIICVGDSFQLTDVSLPINGNINSWQWKDASTTFSSLQNPKYILYTSGSKDVFLKVTTNLGCVDSITKSLVVNPLPDASFTLNPSTYLFNDSPISFTPNFSSAVNYFWNVSDGNTYTDPSLILTFINQGAYTVSLQLTDNLGCINNSSQAFNIGVRNTDLGIIAARSTIDNDGFVGVEADLFNYGSTPITEFEILYELTGGGIMKESWAADTLPPGAILLFKFSAKSFLSVNERENAISCITIQTVNTKVDDNISNNENCAALNSSKQLVAEPFPNPADGDVSLPIVLTEDQTITITVYDYLGKLIAENITYDGVTGLNFIKIPCAAYSSGTYTLRISISDNNYIRKLIKQGSTK